MAYKLRNSEHRYAEASYGTRYFALLSPTLFSLSTQHSALYT
uniref:Uncharacterized protein n=1 Tax=Desertifilum tharense IPPAS B-1220 TaxID=1781255 RepID=A0ACD5GUS8_9CYAN